MNIRCIFAASVLFAMACAGSSEQSAGPTPTPTPTPAKTPSSLQIVSGNAQTGTVGAELGSPIVVKVLDASGAALSGATVTFSTSNGSFKVSSDKSDASGQVQAFWTIGTLAGSQSATVSVTGVSAQALSATGVAGAFERLRAAGDTLRLYLGDESQLVPQDRYGNKAEASPTWTSLDQSIATVSSTGFVRTIAVGVARIVGTAAGKSDTARVKVSGAPTPSGVVATATQVSMPTTGIVNTEMSTPVVFRLTTSAGTPVSGAKVTFFATDGPIYGEAPNGSFRMGGSTYTDANGQITAYWTLGKTAGTQGASFRIDGLTRSYQISVTATPGPLARVVGGKDTISIAAVNDTAKLTPVDEFANTITSGVTWTSLDQNIATVSATGTARAVATGTARIVATNGTRTDTARVAVRNCASMAALNLSVGQSAVVRAPGCGALLPTASNALYRVGVMPRQYAGYTPRNTSVIPVSGDLKLVASVAAGASASRVLSQRPLAAPTADPGPGRDFIGDAESMARLARVAPELRFSPGKKPTVRANKLAADPPTRRTFTPPYEGWNWPSSLIYNGTNLIVYKADEVPAPNMSQLIEQLEIFDQYGMPIIESYFGGVGPAGTTNLWKGGARDSRDVDGNGKIIVVLMPDSLKVQAIVVQNDRLPRPENASTAAWAEGSGEGEIFYMKAGTTAAVMTHEMRHVSSVGYMVFNNRPEHEYWLEEGGADLAANLEVRAAQGLTESQEITSAQMSRPVGSFVSTFITARGYLRAAPYNAMIGNPAPNPSGMSCYGSGFMFTQFVADNYSSAFGGPAGFYRSFNTSATAGIKRLETMTGKSLADLQAEFVAALSVEGTPAARAAAPKRFRSFDIASMLSFIDQNAFPAGNFPYVIGSYTYGSRDIVIPAYYSSLAFYDFTSSGTVPQRLQLVAGTGAPLPASLDAVMVVTRLR